MSYSLNLFSLRGEGQKIVMTGEKGVIVYEGVGPAEVPSDHYTIKIFHQYGKPEIHTFPKLTGRHAGSDKILCGKLFGAVIDDDPLGQMADSFAGITSALMGISANESIATGKTIDIAERLDKMR